MVSPRRSAGWAEGQEPHGWRNAVVPISIVTALGLPVGGLIAANNFEDTGQLQAIPSEPVSSPEPSASPSAATPTDDAMLTEFKASPKPAPKAKVIPKPNPAPTQKPSPKPAPKPTAGPVPAGLSGASASVKKIAVATEQLFPSAGPYGGYRPADGYGEHSTGKAIDIMVPNLTVGQAVADYFKANAKEYNVKHIIWNHRIWSVERSAEGWRQMEDRGNPTENHENHPHIMTN